VVLHRGEGIDLARLIEGQRPPDIQLLERRDLAPENQSVGLLVVPLDLGDNGYAEGPCHLDVEAAGHRLLDAPAQVSLDGTVDGAGGR